MSTLTSEPSFARGRRVLRVYHSAVVAAYRERERCLRALGYDVHLAAPPRSLEGGNLVELEPEASDLPVHVLPVHGRTSHPNLFWYSPRALRRLLITLEPEIVDLHEEPFGLAVAAALPVIRRYAPDAAICLYTAQNLPKVYPPPFSWFESRALNAAACAYPCSDEAGARLRRQGFRGRVATVPLGVSLPAPGPERHGARPVIGFVGRLESYKGADIALEAFLIAARTRDVEMIIIGSGSDQARLREIARRSGLSGRITFTGALSQSETQAAMAGIDILAVPSLTTAAWKEQFGRVVVEGFAAGCVVVASDSGSLPEVVGTAGRLAPEGDVAAWAEIFGSLLDDPAQRQALGARGLERAPQFSWSSVAEQMSSLYEDAVAA